MHGTETWLKVICALQINVVAFGIFDVAILSTPALNAHAAILIPAAIVASVVISPVIAWRIAPQMHRKDEGEHRGQQADLIPD